MTTELLLDTKSIKRAMNQKLISLGNRCPDGHESFGKCLEIMCNAEGVTEDMISYLEYNPTANTSQILEYFDLIVDGV